jgi:hypothetical protein
VTGRPPQAEQQQKRTDAISRPAAPRDEAARHERPGNENGQDCDRVESRQTAAPHNLDDDQRRRQDSDHAQRHPEPVARDGDSEAPRQHVPTNVAGQPRKLGRRQGPPLSESASAVEDTPRPDLRQPFVPRFSAPALGRAQVHLANRYAGPRRPRQRGPDAPHAERADVRSYSGPSLTPFMPSSTRTVVAGVNV